MLLAWKGEDTKKRQGHLVRCRSQATEMKQTPSLQSELAAKMCLPRNCIRLKMGMLIPCHRHVWNCANYGRLHSGETEHCRTSTQKFIKYFTILSCQVQPFVFMHAANGSGH